MKRRKPMIDELFNPLLERHRPTQADRDRLQAKIRARIADSSGAPLSTSTSAKAASTRGFLANSFRRWGWIGSGMFALAGIGIVLSARHENRQETHQATSHEIASPGASDPTSPTAPVQVVLAVPSAPGLPTETAEDIGAARMTPPASPAPSASVPADGHSLGSSVGVETLPSVGALAKRAEPSGATSNEASKAAATVPSESDALERETNLWRRVVRARNDGKWDESLRLLDQHAREFPHGVLAAERVVERIGVLCHVGRRDEASRESATFLATHPNSLLRSRVESTCGAPSASSGSQTSPASPSARPEPANTPLNTLQNKLNEAPEPEQAP